GGQRRGRELDLGGLRGLASGRACVYSRCSSPWNLSRPRGSGAAPVLGLTTGSRRSFHQALLAVAAVVPLPPVVKKAGGCGCDPPRFLPSVSGSGTVRSVFPGSLPCRESPWGRKRRRSSLCSTAASSFPSLT